MFSRPDEHKKIIRLMIKARWARDSAGSARWQRFT
jgi:hypothetical protein